MKTLRLVRTQHTRTHAHIQVCTRVHTRTHARTHSRAHTSLCHLSPSIIPDGCYTIYLFSSSQASISYRSINDSHWAPWTFNSSVTMETYPSSEKTQTGPVWVSLNHIMEQGSVYMLWDRTRGRGWGRHGSHWKLPETDKAHPPPDYQRTIPSSLGKAASGS